MSVDVRWEVAQEDDADFVGGTGKQLTLLPGEWARGWGNAESAAAHVASDYFNTEMWEEWIGLDDSSATVRLRIHSPEEIAGEYLVNLERVTNARARRIGLPFARRPTGDGE